MALDLAVTTGFAIGDAGKIPRSGSVRLKRPKDEYAIAAFNLLAFLRDTFTLDRPDLVAIEDFMHPSRQKSAAAVILSLMLFGVAVAVCRSYGVRVETPNVNTIRLHFCGAANAGARADTKAMVIRRATLLGYIPRGCADNNRADACAAFDFASAHYARVQPRELVKFQR
jgi:Holliday junction resolvasome RuvABC endonuclease subunit